MKLKKSISLILTLALVLSASVAVSSFNISAKTGGNLISGGDFEGGDPLGNFYSTTGESNSVSVVEYQFDNGSTANKAVKLMRTAEDDPYGRAISYDLKKLNLSAGSYKLTFDADITNTNSNAYAFYYGIYNGTYDKYGMFYSDEADSSNKDIVTTVAANTFLERATGSINGVAAYNDKNNKGTRLSFSNATGDTAKAKIVLEFSVDGTEENLYFSAGVTKGVTAYIDNVALVSTERITDGVLATPNSDFEEGNLTGFVAGSNVKIVSEPVNETDSTTFTGSAAYLGPRTGAASSNITYAMTIPAGKYNISFDLDVFAGTVGGNIIVGLYKGTPDTSYNRGYANTNDLIAAPKAYDKSTSSLYSYAEDYKWGKGTVIKFANTGDNKNLKFVSDFEVTEETTAFLGIGFISDSTDYAYLDNIKVTAADSDELLTNGKFEYGSLYGYEYNYNGEDRITVTDNGAFIPRRTKSANGKFLNQKVKLSAGDYVFKFDADIDYIGSESVLFSVATNLDSMGRAYGKDHVISAMSGACIKGNYALNNYASDNGVGVGAFAIKSNSKDKKTGTWAAYFSLDSEQEVYVSIGIMGTGNPSQNSNATAFISNLSLKKDTEAVKTITSTSADSETKIYTYSSMRNHFVPYGGAIDADGKILDKNFDGTFAKKASNEINLSYFKKPSADGITTFGASYKTADNTSDNGIQFGSYTESVTGKEFYTLIIRGKDASAVNALTTEQKTAMVNKYLNWNSSLADKWGGLTVDGIRYEIKVVKQNNYMWKDADTDNTKLQYAVRLYGDYSGENGNVSFSAIGFSKTNDTVNFADSFKTASYNGLAG